MKPLEEIIKENKEADVKQEVTIDDLITRYLNIKKSLQTVELTKENYDKIIKFLGELKGLTFDQETLIIEGDKDK